MICIMGRRAPKAKGPGLQSIKSLLVGRIMVMGYIALNDGVWDVVFAVQVSSSLAVQTCSHVFKGLKIINADNHV